MPSPYGTTDGANFKPNACTPLYQHNGFLYCKAYIQTSSSGFAGYLFKVNMTTNVVTPITGATMTWDYDLTNARHFQVSANGDIYFNGWQTKIFKINPTTNTILDLGNFDYDFFIDNNKLYTTGQQVVKIFDLNTQTYDPQPTIIINSVIYYPLISAFYKVNSEIFGVGYFSSDYYSQKFFKFIGNSLQILNSAPSNCALNGLEPSTDKPYLLNNKLIYKSQNLATTDVDIISLDISDYSITTILQYPAAIFNPFDNFILNNQLYLKKNEEMFVTNGSSLATLTNIPSISSNGRGFVGNPQNNIINGGNISTILFNNIVLGKKYFNTNNFEIWKTDGTNAGTVMINNSLNLYSGIIVNNKIYFANIAGYYNSNIYQYEITTQQFTPIQIFSNNEGNLDSSLYGYNNSIFYTSLGNNTLNNGLFKIDLNSLASENFIKNNVTVSPNPTTSTLNIQSQNPIIDLKIIDITGRSTNPNFENNKIDVSNLANGIYLLETTTANGSFREKFIKN